MKFRRQIVFFKKKIDMSKLYLAALGEMMLGVKSWQNRQSDNCEKKLLPFVWAKQKNIAQETKF